MHEMEFVANGMRQSVLRLNQKYIQRLKSSGYRKQIGEKIIFELDQLQISKIVTFQEKQFVLFSLIAFLKQKKASTQEIIYYRKARSYRARQIQSRTTIAIEILIKIFETKTKEEN